MKMHFCIDKFDSYPQFQPSFQHSTVKICLKCLKPALLLKTMLIMLKSGFLKGFITVCKLICTVLNPFIIPWQNLPGFVAKTPVESFQHAVENYV